VTNMQLLSVCMSLDQVPTNHSDFRENWLRRFSSGYSLKALHFTFQQSVIKT